VSHELRTPLTSIRGALGLVGSGRLGTLNDQGKKMIDIAVTDTDRLVRLINDMLDIERMQSGRIEMHKAACEADDLTRQAVEGVQRLADAAEVHVEAVGAEKTQLHCDSDRILQTLTNLLGNAIKFSPKGGIVTLRVSERADEVEFRISDQGRGIPKAKIETIFERFQQVDASDAREKGGAGLGLAISRSIVVQHGGRIWAESDGENGSTFVFTLPRPTQRADSNASQASDSLLLVAEDESSAAAVLRTMLETNGYAVAVAGTGTQAVEMAATLQPAAILLDIIMPEMNGWDAMAALKANPATANIPIIVVSGLSAEVGHFDERVVAWVDKPFDESVLARALQKAFGDLRDPEVLIVEDDENLATVLSTQFEGSGLRCVVARDGSEAIKLAQERAPNLLVLDLMLPERDGFDVVDWLRQHEQLRHLPLVVYTALELDEAQKLQLTLGPSVFMTKAKEKPEEVARRVTHLLNRVSGRSNE
jgi:CheY-like chemotaxis protein/anti-sigma regulatory factor (Ser/Thr protein kinase)